MIAVSSARVGGPSPGGGTDSWPELADPEEEEELLDESLLERRFFDLERLRGERLLLALEARSRPLCERLREPLFEDERREDERRREGERLFNCFSCRRFFLRSRERDWSLSLLTRELSAELFPPVESTP